MKDDSIFLAHIRDALALISEYASHGREYFDATSMCRDAIVRQFEIIGEASKHITEGFRSAHPEVPWQDLAGLRDVLIHQYWSVNLDRLWQAVVQEVPGTLAALNALLEP